MRKHTILNYCSLFLFFVSFACQNGQNPKAQGNQDPEKSFEGIVEYKVSYKQKTDTLESYIYEYLEQKYGPKEIRYISEKGEFKSVYPESGIYGVDYDLFKKDSMTNFYLSKTTDTIFYFDVRKNKLKFISENEEPDEMINGEKCKCFSYSALDEAFNQPIKLVYCYSGLPFLDPELYSGYEDSYYEKALRKSRSVFTKLAVEFNDYAYTFEIESIKPKKLKKSVFDLPKNRPFKNY